MQRRINQPTICLGLDVGGWFKLGLDGNAPVFKFDKNVNSMSQPRLRGADPLLGVRFNAARPEERGKLGIQEWFMGIAVLTRVHVSMGRQRQYSCIRLFQNLDLQS